MSYLSLVIPAACSVWHKISIQKMFVKSTGPRNLVPKIISEPYPFAKY